MGPAFFRGRLWIEHQPQDTFLKLQASPLSSLDQEVWKLAGLDSVYSVVVLLGEHVQC